jgi:hypothetical protein
MSNESAQQDVARASVREVLARERPRREQALARVQPLRADDPDVVALVADLASDATRDSLRNDPYWPKWSSPWWKLLLLHELGLGHVAPRAAIDALAHAINEKYLTFFPFTEDQVPPGTDSHRDVMCHCALGCVTTLLRASGRDVEAAIPWTRGWFLRYQLPDGGVNCDEAVYVRDNACSSVVSTVPTLEAVLSKGVRSPGENAFLARGARYLLDRQVGTVSRATGATIDASWFEPIFPRFYFYDVLRGLTFLTRWALETDHALPARALAAPLNALAERVGPEGGLAPRRNDDHGTAKTLVCKPDGQWEKGVKVSTFPLLARVQRTDAPSATLTRAWYDALDALAKLDEKGRLT